MIISSITSLFVVLFCFVEIVKLLWWERGGQELHAGLRTETKEEEYLPPQGCCDVHLMLDAPHKVGLKQAPYALLAAGVMHHAGHHVPFVLSQPRLCHPWLPGRAG